MSVTLAVIALVVIVVALALMMRGGVPADRSSNANNTNASRYSDGDSGI